MDEKSNVYSVPSFNSAPEEIENESSEVSKLDINSVSEEIENESSEVSKEDIFENVNEQIGTPTTS